MRKHQPVIAVDFDGPINIRSMPDGFSVMTLTFPSGGNGTPWFHLSEETISFIVNPERHMEIINGWRDRGAEVVWGSLWHDHTVNHLNHMGFDLSNGFHGVDIPDRFDNDPIGWKRYALQRNYGDRPILLVDDSVRTVLGSKDGVDTIHVPEELGIEAVTHLVDKWLAELGI